MMLNLRRNYLKLINEQLNVKDYGATGDGTTNDTQAIADAIDDLPSTGGVIFFPDGTYVCDVVLNKDNITMHLSGKARIESYSTHAVLITGAECSIVGENPFGSEIDGLDKGSGVYVQEAVSCSISNCNVSNTPGNGTSRSAITLLVAFFSNIDKCVISGSDRFGIFVGSRGSRITSCVFQGGSIDDKCIRVDGVGSNVIVGNYFENPASAAVEFAGSEGNVFVSNTSRTTMTVTLDAFSDNNVVMGNPQLTVTDNGTNNFIISDSGSKIVGDFDLSDNKLIDPKNNANTTVSGTVKTVEIEIDGTPYYFLVSLTSSA